MGSKNSISSSRGKAVNGGACLIPFGLIFAGMGGVFMYFVLSEFADEAATYQWTETLCEIRSVDIEANQKKEKSPFRLNIEYGYIVDGKNYTSTQYTLKEHWSGDFEPLALKRKALLNAADGTVCFVNPKNPAEAVVKREAILKGLIALFPLVFVVVGLALTIGGIASLRKTKAAKESKRLDSISNSASAKNQGGRAVLLIMGVIFTLVGGGLSVFLGLVPLTRMMESKQWVQTPCEVIWSRVISHRGDDSTTYSIDIFYKYDFDGAEHRSNRYGFMTGSSSGRKGKQDVVRQYRKGSKKVCFVNPKIPEQATLVRGFTPWVLLGLIPLVFFGAGIAMLIGWRRSGKKKAVRGISEPDSINEARGPKTLKPGGSRIAGVLVMLFVGLFWNGIVSVFLVQVVDGFKRDRPEWFLTIFMIPFVIVGLIFILVFLYKLLSLANARPEVTLDQGQPRLGEESWLSWKIVGNARRISRFKIEVWGIESATYRRGTKTVTDKKVFFQRTLADSADGGDIASGRAQFQLPEDLVPSMNLGSNDIIWQIKVNGDVPFFPDVQDSYKIEVLPAGFS
ncbi:MAG: DUF3592 domain-containing protein [Verrucomicrobiales bacterium]